MFNTFSANVLIHPLPMNGIVALTTAQTGFVWKIVDLRGKALTDATILFMGGGCTRFLGRSDYSIFYSLFWHKYGVTRSTVGVSTRARCKDRSRP